MAVKIGHAVHSETGGLEGARGDQIQQQGKKNEEVQIAKWYVSGEGWSWYIEAKDPVLRELMAVLMEQACANPNIGYSRTNRFDWYVSAKEHGGDVTLAEGDCDCSSLVSGIANLAGAKVTYKLATASMLKAFKASGQFNIYTDADHLETDKLARRGGIYLRVGHTAMVLSNGAGASSESTVPPQTETIKPPYVVSKGTVHIRSGNGTSFKSLGKTKDGQKLQYVCDEAEPPNWYRVIYNGAEAWISSNPKYTRLVTK